MFEKLFTSAKNSPFAKPFDLVHCETKANETRTIGLAAGLLGDFNV